MANEVLEMQCPQCGSKRLYRDGFRYLKDGTTIQRLLCRSCGYRFSQTQLLKRKPSKGSICQVGAAPSPRRVKNLVKVEPLKEGLAGATETNIKGKLLEFAWHMKKDGLSERTIQTYGKLLEWLIKKGASLFDPESVKEVIALQDDWSQGTKHQAVQAYNKFAKMNGLKWEKPKYKPIRKKPFIPLEKELDALINACGKKTSARLQLLKETGMRIGEALRLEWVDVDSESNIITVNHPEKNGESRQIPVSSRLIAILNQMSKKDKKIFGNVTRSGVGASFYLQRKRVAAKLQNARIMQISFHTFRHWKATMEYHRTKDVLYVMRLLGHRSISSTLLYTQLVVFKSDEWICKRTKTKEEEDKLIEAGFELVRYDRLHREAIYRKRK